MDSTNERKRSFETALEEEFSDDRQTKRPRLFEGDFQSDQNVLETASQPVLQRFVLANRLEHAGPVSSSAPPIINDFSENMGHVNERTLPLIGPPYDSPLPRSTEDNGLVTPTARSESEGSMAMPTQTSTHLSVSVFTNESTLEGDSTDHQTTYGSPEMPPSSFFTVQGQVEGAGNTDLLGYGARPQADAPSDSNLPEALEADKTIDTAVGLFEPPTVPHQAAPELQEDSQIGVESPLTTPRSPLQLPSQVVQPEATATPPKSAMPSSSPLSTLASSPFGSPKSISKEKNPFSVLNSQKSSASVDEAPPPEVMQGDTEPAKPAQSSELPARSKKENIYPEKKGESSDSGLKPHEASSNLSKSSPNHPSVPSQHRSAKKIRTPFRSPLFSKTLGSNQQQPGGGEGKTALPTKSNLSSTLQFASGGSELKKRGALRRIKGTGTSAARAAFKSPLRAGPSTPGAPKLTPNAFSSSHKGVSRNDPVQNRLQLLRRAVKIKESGEDEKLEALVGKWREVAKEVAWELWGLVKEGNVGEGIESRISAGSSAAGPFGPFGGNDRGWGNGGFGAAGGEDSQQNWGWAAGAEEDAAEGSVDIRAGKGDAKGGEEDEEPKVEERSMGAMLRQLGIAQETLGWDEEEGDFTEITA